MWVPAARTSACQPAPLQRALAQGRTPRATLQLHQVNSVHAKNKFVNFTRLET